MGATGFWSYSHDDNEHDGQAILRLAARIQAEFALVTGGALNLFIDRNDISWGDEWRRRIGMALVETTFFIPVITPLYFKRQECRNELLSFVGQAQSLGAVELVMPILYVEVPDLTEDSPDEACAIVARMHYADWRKLRLCAEDSAEYRQGINSLAQRLAEISRQYERNSMQQADSDSEGDEEGIIDLIESIEQKVPRWIELNDSVQTGLKQFEALSNPYVERLKKFEKQGLYGHSGAILTILRGLASDTEPVLKRSVESSKDLLAVTIDLDPLVLQVLRSLLIYPELLPDVTKSLEPMMAEAENFIDEDEDPHISTFKRFAGRFKGYSKHFRHTIISVEDLGRYSGDYASIVWNWKQGLEEAKNETSVNSRTEFEAASMQLPGLR